MGGRRARALTAATAAAAVSAAAIALGSPAWAASRDTAVPSAGQAQAAAAQFIPHLVYRTGPYAPTGIPLADGMADYFTLVNVRDGGVGGVPLVFEECDTAYSTDRGVACYEALKAKGPTGAAVVLPLSTGITYALIERTRADRIPLFSSGYGRADAGDGRVFPYVFTLPASYWTGADAAITHIADGLGGTAALKGRRIALVHHDSAFGREPVPLLEELSGRYGFVLETFPIAPPGLEQKAVWLQVARQFRADDVLLWGWGMLNSAALKEAAAVGFPADRIIGVWWAGSEQDVQPAGDAARGYKALAFHAAGDRFPVIDAIRRHVLERGRGAGDGSHVGSVLYNRGLYNAVVVVEAIRTAQRRFGARPLTGEEVRWGFETLDLNAQTITALGLDGFMQPLRITCADHEGMTPIRIHQWTGSAWVPASDWIEPNRPVIRALVETSAAAYAAEKKLPPQACP